MPPQFTKSSVRITAVALFVCCAGCREVPKATEPVLLSQQTCGRPTATARDTLSGYRQGADG